MDKLAEALATLLADRELTNPLARVLACASLKGSVSYTEVENLAGDDLDEALLLAHEWRLIIPTRIAKSGAWEDRLLLCRPGESYQVPNIVRCLAEEASKTGCWNPEHAITKLFKEMGEPGWQRIPKLVGELGKQARGYQISATQIRQVCIGLGLGDRVDVLIAELKSSGIMSPKLSSLAEVIREGAPLYELNPSILYEGGLS